MGVDNIQMVIIKATRVDAIARRVSIDMEKRTEDRVLGPPT